MPEPPRADGAGGGGGLRPRRARLAERVTLTKPEAFEACQALADADRWLIREGHPREAVALGRVFDLLESRLAGSRPSGPGAQARPPGSEPAGPTPEGESAAAGSGR